MGEMIIIDKETDEIVDVVTNKKGLISCLYTRKADSDEMSINYEIEYGATEEIKKGNKIVVQDEEGQYREFAIEEFEEIDGEVIVGNSLPTFISDVGLSKPVKAGTVYDNLTTAEIISRMIKNSGWVVGNVDYYKTETINVEETIMPFPLLKDFTSKRNLKLEFKVEFNLGKISRRYLDLVERKKIYSGKEIRRGKDLNSLTRREVIKDVITALLVEYKVRREVRGEEVEETRYIELFNDKVNKEISKDGSYRWGHLSSTEETYTEARREGQAYLTENSKVVEGFEVDVEDLGEFLDHEKVSFGDLVYIKDSTVTPSILMGGEVIQVEYDISDASTKKYVVGDIIKLQTVLGGVVEKTKKLEKKDEKMREEMKRRIDRAINGDTGELSDDELFEHNKITRDTIEGVSTGGGDITVDDSLYDVEGRVSLHVDQTPKLLTREPSLRIGRGLEMGIYTLTFDVESDRDTELTIARDSLLIPLNVTVDGEYVEIASGWYWGHLGSDNMGRTSMLRNLSIGKKSKKVRLTVAIDSHAEEKLKDNWAFQLWLEGEIEAIVTLENLVIYEGTSKYENKDIGIRGLYNSGQVANLENKDEDYVGKLSNSYGSSGGFRFTKGEFDMYDRQEGRGDNYDLRNTRTAVRIGLKKPERESDTEYEIYRVVYKVRLDEIRIGSVYFHYSELHDPENELDPEGGISFGVLSNNEGVIRTTMYTGSGDSLQKILQLYHRRIPGSSVDFESHLGLTKENYGQTYTIEQICMVRPGTDFGANIYYRTGIGTLSTYVGRTDFTVSDIYVEKGIKPGYAGVETETDEDVKKDFTLGQIVVENEEMKQALKSLSDRIAELEKI